MVTGVEVAGLALATFPLVVSGLSHYVEGLETIRSWRQFRRELRTYSIAFETERFWYLDTLEELLEGIVESSEELASMVADPRHPSWRKPKYQERLQARLDRSYDLFFCKIEDMVKRLGHIQTKLGVDPNNNVSMFTSMEGMTGLRFRRSHGMMCHL